MKIRNGFVSNSSSSSFVAVIPNNLDVERAIDNSITVLIEAGSLMPRYVRKEYLTSDGDISADKIKEAALGYLPHGSMWIDDDYDAYRVIKHALTKYSIASFETGPEGGEIYFIKQEQIEDMLKKFNEEQ
jgi:hypothetical protein